MRMKSSTLQVLLATAFSYVSAFAISKLVAITMGPGGIALLGAVLGTASIAASIALLGQQNSIPVWVANHRAESSGSTVALAALATILILPLALVPTVIAGVALLGEYASTGILAIGLGLATAGQAWALLAVSLLSALRGSAALLQQAVIAGSVNALVTGGGILILDSSWLPVILGVGGLAGSAAAFLPYLRLRGLRCVSVPRGVLRSYMTSGLSTLPGVVINAFVIGGLPVLVLTLTTETTAGLFRSAWSLSAVILAVSYSVIRGLYFPAAARLVAQDDDFGSLHRPMASRLVALTALSAVLVTLLAPQLLSVLYSAEFASAAGALSLLTVLTLARVGVYLNQFWLNANGRGTDFSLVEGVFMVFLLLGVVAGCSVGSAESIAIGGALAGVAAVAASEVLLFSRGLRHPLSQIPWWGAFLVAMQFGAVAWVQLRGW
jgi:O-antigen/teichoic acid export membrane protein